jgi:hypothetical protein
MDFDKALKALPINTSYDFFSHKTIDDLAYVCLHELDLHAEGEYKIALPLRKKYLKFILKYGSDHHKSEANQVFKQGLNQTQWYDGDDSFDSDKHGY